MCTPKNSIKLCSCGQKIKRMTFWNKLFYGKRNRADREAHPDKNCWTLYSKDNEVDIDGDLMLPEEALTLKKNLEEKYSYLTEQLNQRKDCFDFDYSPQLEDELIINLEGNVVSFVFDEQWCLVTPNCSGLSDWDYWKLNEGIIKKT